MKFCILTSGSKGNCTFIEINNHKYLIDIGCTFLYAQKKLEEINVDIKDIEGIFITHAHKDHIAGLKKTIKSIKPKIYLTEKIAYDINDNIENYIFLDEKSIINNVNVSILPMSHDVTECVGYLFEYNEKDLVYITDTGYINEKYNNLLNNRMNYVIESNHDVNLLLESSRPYFLKSRILGDCGHLSNKDCAYYLNKVIGERTKNIVLAHLSEESNTHQLALDTVTKLINYDNNIYTAYQNERTEVFNV